MLTAKLRQLALVLSTPKATRDYPAQPQPPAAGFRGLPAIDGERCLGCGACAHVCPARLISLTQSENRLVLNADLGRCTYCARCEDVCPAGAFRMTDRFETTVDDPRRLSIRIELEMAACPRCHRTVESRHMVAFVAEKYGLADSLSGLCPDCRRREFGGRLKWKGGKSHG